MRLADKHPLPVDLLSTTIKCLIIHLRKTFVVRRLMMQKKTLCVLWDSSGGKLMSDGQ